MKVDNALALDALEMLVAGEVGVEPLGIARSLHNKGCADVTECQEGSIDGVQGDAREDQPDLTEHHLGRGVLVAFHQGLVDGGALRSDPQSGFVALCVERSHLLFDVLLTASIGCRTHSIPHQCDWHWTACHWV